MAAQATAVFQAPSAAPRSGKSLNFNAVPQETVTLTFRVGKKGVVLATRREGSRLITYLPDRDAAAPKLDQPMDCKVFRTGRSTAEFAIRIVKILGPSETARLAAITEKAAAAAKATMSAITPQPKVEDVVDQLVAAAIPGAAAEPVPVGDKVVAPEVHETPGVPAPTATTAATEPAKDGNISAPTSKKKDKNHKVVKGAVYNDNGRRPRGARGGGRAQNSLEEEFEAIMNGESN